VGSYTNSKKKTQTKKKRSVEDVKYIMFWELAPEDMQKALEKNTKALEEMEKDPEKYMKPIFVPHALLGDLPIQKEKARGFTIFESDDHKKILEFIHRFYPEFRATFVPIEPVQRRIER